MSNLCNAGTEKTLGLSHETEDGWLSLVTKSTLSGDDLQEIHNRTLQWWANGRVPVRESCGIVGKLIMECRRLHPKWIDTTSLGDD